MKFFSTLRDFIPRHNIHYERLEEHLFNYLHKGQINPPEFDKDTLGWKVIGRKRRSHRDNGERIVTYHIVANHDRFVYGIIANRRNREKNLFCGPYVIIRFIKNGQRLEDVLNKEIYDDLYSNLYVF